MDVWGPICLNELNLIQSGIRSYILWIVWNDITYPFLNFNGVTAW